MDDIDAGLDQRGQPGRHFIRRGGKAGGEVLLLPLADAQDDREIRTNGGTHRSHDFAGKGCTFGNGFAAKAIGAQVRPRPEELINQIAVCAMDFKGVKPGILGIKGGLGKGGNGISNIGIRHGIAARLIRRQKARRAFDRGIGFPFGKGAG